MDNDFKTLIDLIHGIDSRLLVFEAKQKALIKMVSEHLYEPGVFDKLFSHAFADQVRKFDLGPQSVYDSDIDLILKQVRDRDKNSDNS